METTGKNTKHEELTRMLRELAQTLRSGDRFPSQAELMRRFQLSDRTVQRSLDDLEHAGWIVRRHGSGTFIADPKLRRQDPSVPAGVASKTLAALTPSLESFYKHCVDLLTIQAESSGLALICHHTQNPANYYEDALPLEALNPLGFLLFSYSLLPIARRLMRHGHRVVLVGAPPVDTVPEAPTVYGDHERGGYMAARHLLDLGHQRIAFANNSARYPHPLPQRLRWRGHQRALRDAERLGQAALIEPATLAGWNQEPPQAAAFFRRPDAPTGVAVWNDREAMLLLGILYRAGLRVPEEVSVIGYDALPEGEVSLPPLTTVDQHIDAQLRAALDLLSRPSPPPETQSVVVVPTLVSRASCAPPGGSTAVVAARMAGT